MDQLDHCFCMFKMDTQESEVIPSIIRRVDIIVAPYEQYPWALVGWTGSKVTFDITLLIVSKKGDMISSIKNSRLCGIGTKDLHLRSSSTDTTCSLILYTLLMKY